MSPYFPKDTERQPYKCGGCGGWFYHSNTSCCVLHPPGSCCHEYESPAAPPPRDSLTAKVYRILDDQFTRLDGVFRKLK